MSTTTATPKQPKPKTRQQAMEQGKIIVKDGVSHYVSAFEPAARHPVFEMRLTLASEITMRLFLGTCESAQRSLYSLYCLAPIVLRGEQQMVNETHAVVGQRFDEIETKLNEEWQRLQHLAETDGADGAARYVGEAPLVVEVMTPAMARYLGLISTADGMMRTLDALWFAMRVPATERNHKMLEWRNRIARFQRELFALQQRLFRAGTRKSNGQTNADSIEDVAGDITGTRLSDDDDSTDDESEEDDMQVEAHLPASDTSLAVLAPRRKATPRKRALADEVTAAAA